tara:strand:- start:31411 stop:31734 length:324 start_codon:yes stop_codon:yes gene_type:complete
VWYAESDTRELHKVVHVDLLERAAEDLRQELNTDVTRRRDEGYTYENLAVRLPGLAVALRNPVIEETHRALHGVGELREAVLDVVLQVRRGAGTGPRRMPLRRRSYI